MDFLKALNINDTNAGVSTGLNWIKSKGYTISSYSPVEGKLIGNGTSADVRNTHPYYQAEHQRTDN